MKYKNLLSLTAAFLIGTASVFATGTEKEKESGNSYTFANNPFNSLATNSYKYNTAVGIRGLGTSGLTIKHFTRANRAVEGIVGFIEATVAMSAAQIWPVPFDPPAECECEPVAVWILNGQP